MYKPIFFHPDLDGNSGSVILSQDESRHLMAARRLRAGDDITLMNGQGVSVAAKILTLDKRASEVTIESIEQTPEPSRQLTVCTGIPKGDRQRFMVESLVQLGVSRIVPIESEYSATKVNHKSLDKWPRYAIEAMKQCGNPWLPEIMPGSSLDALLEAPVWSTQDCCYLADLDPENSSSESAQNQNVVIMIGPEGGFSHQEKEQILSSGFSVLQLGKYILRTEVAAIAAAAHLSPATQH